MPGLPLPAAGICISPWVDLAPESVLSDSWQRNYPAVDFLPPDLVYPPHSCKSTISDMGCFLSQAAQFATAYAGGKSFEEVSPTHMDLTGLPPLFVTVGECECLRDQIESFVVKARAAGIFVDFHVARDMVHVYPLFADLSAWSKPPNTIWTQQIVPFLSQIFSSVGDHAQHSETLVRVKTRKKSSE